MKMGKVVESLEGEVHFAWSIKDVSNVEPRNFDLIWQEEEASSETYEQEDGMTSFL